MQTLRGRHIDFNETISLNIEEGRIAFNKAETPVLERQFDPFKGDFIISKGDPSLPIIAPGLVDLQVNGYKGVDFNDASLDEAAIHTIVHALLAQGVTSFYPTIITNDPVFINQQLQKIRQVVDSSPRIRSCIAGVHLEGPFISLVEGPLGAHDRQYVRAPDKKLMAGFLETGLVKIITLSPEWPEAPEFIGWCVQQGVTVSIGHTAANSEQISRAVDAGASMSTHLGNAAHQLLPRHPNYIWDQLANDALAAGFIGDGFHLPDSVMRTILRIKGNRAIMVSDSVSLAGEPPGVYTTPVGGKVVLSEEGRLSLADNPAALAGSAQNLFEGVKTLVRKGICSLAEAWRLASSNPTREMRLPFALTPGTPADLVLLDDRDGITILDVYKNGEKI
jgi:N-acetylglucosamine-6-phosphate deacetylase